VSPTIGSTGTGATFGTSQGASTPSGQTGTGFIGTGATYGTSQGASTPSGQTGTGFTGTGATYGTSQGASTPSGQTGTGFIGTGATYGTSQGASTPSGQTGTTLLTSFGTGTTVSGGSTFTGTTTKRCQEMQAVDEPTSKQITVTPTDVPQESKPEFQPSSKQGVSFPENEKNPTITVTFGKPAEVQSVTLPKDKTPNGNVERFEVTFYSPDGKKVNEKPISSTSSPKDDKNKPAAIDSTKIPSNTPISRVDITVVETTYNKSPKGVVIDIKACTEITTGQFLSLDK